MKILFDGYLMKWGQAAAGELKNPRFIGKSTDLPADSYLMVI
jgi:hypothetical protein